MLTRFSLRALGVGAALALTAACSGNALAPSQSPTSLYRTLRGPRRLRTNHRQHGADAA